MKRSNRLVILVGVLLAVLAFVGIVILLNQTREPIAAEEPTAAVLVATQDIAIGDAVTPEVVEETTVDLGAVVGTPLVDVSQVQGQRALFAVPAGSQVTQETIGLAVGNRSIGDQLLPGEKAIAFQVDRTTGLDFLVREGDIIDVVVSQQIQVLQPTADSLDNPDAPPRFEAVTGLESARTVKVVLQNKRVLYVSDTRLRQTAPAAEDPAAPETDEAAAPETPIENVIIVFAGTDADAEVIKFAQRDLNELGNLTAVVRSTEDQAIEETEGVTIDELVDRYGLPVPGIVDLEELTPTE